MENKIIEVIGALSEKFGIAYEKSSEMLSALIEKTAAYHCVTNLIAAITGFLLIVASIVLWIIVIKSIKKAKKTKEDTFLYDFHCREMQDEGRAVIALSAVFFVAGIASFGLGLKSFIGWSIAPEYMFLKLFV